MCDLFWLLSRRAVWEEKNIRRLHSSHVLWLFAHNCISSALIGIINIALCFLFHSSHQCSSADLVLQEFETMKLFKSHDCDNESSGIIVTHKHINQRVWAGACIWHPCTRGQSVSMWPVFTLYTLCHLRLELLLSRLKRGTSGGNALTAEQGQIAHRPC